MLLHCFGSWAVHDVLGSCGAVEGGTWTASSMRARAACGSPPRICRTAALFSSCAGMGSSLSACSCSAASCSTLGTCEHMNLAQIFAAASSFPVQCHELDCCPDIKILGKQSSCLPAARKMLGALLSMYGEGGRVKVDLQGVRLNVPVLQGVRLLKAAGAHAAGALQLAPPGLALLLRRRALQLQRLAVRLQRACTDAVPQRCVAKAAVCRPAAGACLLDHCWQRSSKPCLLSA